MFTKIGVLLNDSYINDTNYGRGMILIVYDHDFAG
jgi:hypothetical protein